MNLNRRQVLAGAGLALASGLVKPSSASADLGEFDVVVVGAGAAGMTAALAAAKRGLSCVVVEKAPTYGGSAARSGAADLGPQQRGHPRGKHPGHAREGRAVHGRGRR